MPYKSEKIKIAGSLYDKRIKLTEQDREDIKNLTGMSIRGIARMYGVDKRLIQFILFPERHQKNLLDRKNRGGSKQYYNREKQRQYMKKHRNHKQELYIKGKIKCVGKGKTYAPKGKDNYNLLKQSDYTKK